MRIASSFLLCLAFAAPAAALDVAPGAPVPLGDFLSAREALRSGVRTYNSGDKKGAVRALEFAATKGDALALWKLGRMYADGDGVPHDDLKAFEYFSKIANDNADESPDAPNAPVVASAFTSLGIYFLDGIRASYVKPNVQRAYEMFRYSASYFGDPNAQYNLARLYLDGTGVEKDSRLAARWFNLAAEKGHYQAQALLGHLLVNGEGVPRQRTTGLMWLTMARDAADPDRDGWIMALHDKAAATVSDMERQAALSQLQQHLRRRR